MTFQPISGIRAAQSCAGGPYGWLTPYMASLAAHNQNVTARLFVMRRGELHFIALLIALMGDKRGDADHFGVFARSYGTLTHRTMVEMAAELGGFDAAPALSKLAFSLAGGVWRPAAYLRLAKLMNEPHARKTLRHLPRVTRRHVATLHRLPPAYRTRGVLKMIGRSRDLPEVMFAIELVRRIRTDLTDRQIIASLEKAKASYIRGWVMKHYERVPFPPAPASTPSGTLVIEGVEALRPLGCYADLARAAREFDNCIRDYLWRVQKNDAYFYRYAPEAGGKGVAIVELRRVPAVGWVVHEALGRANDDIKGVDRATILAAFRSVGIGAAPQAGHPGAWFDLD